MANTFHLVLIQPSGYDKEGYVIQWYRAVYPSNGLLTLNALAEDCATRKVLGPDVDISIDAYDELCDLPTVEILAARMKQAPAGCLAALIGMQSSQFPRAADLARRFRAADVPVIMGGIHVSGSIVMLPEIPPELQEMLDLGVSLFVGEAEGRLEVVLRDAQAGALAPIYDYSNDLVDLANVKPPQRLPENVESHLVAHHSRIYPIETGRGCPFKCSFCTVANIHGRKVRAHSGKVVADVIRNGVARGEQRYLITDDNFARNNNWREIFEALAALREQEGLEFSLLFETDTQSDRDPDFIPLAARAGCTHVLIGLESVNPDALAQVNKKHNAVERYQRFFMTWKRYGIVTMAGYIIGFPSDTPESVRRDLANIQQNLGIDILYPFVLTPLPGSADHADLWRQGGSLDPDLSRYNSMCATMPHATMTTRELEDLFRESWRIFYNDEHTARIFRRHVSLGGDPLTLAPFLMVARACFEIEKLHPVAIGWFRIKKRKERRPGLPREAAFTFYLRHAWQSILEQLRWALEQRRMERLIRDSQSYQNSPDYDDPALADLLSVQESPAASE